MTQIGPGRRTKTVRLTMKQILLDLWS